MTTPESLLAAALHAIHSGQAPWPGVRTSDEFAVALYSTEAGARLLAAAEVGLAMRRALDIWPHSFKVYPDGPGWRVQYRLPSETEWTYTDIHDTLTAAIEAALEDKP